MSVDRVVGACWGLERYSEHVEILQRFVLGSMCARGVHIFLSNFLGIRDIKHRRLNSVVEGMYVTSLSKPGQDGQKTLTTTPPPQGSGHFKN